MTAAICRLTRRRTLVTVHKAERPSPIGLKGNDRRFWKYCLYKGGHRQLLISKKPATFRALQQ
jgi:hypothetical protein